ncbi:UNVERIFIED_CONTAM: Prdm12 [Trichonephila clavipes]
MQQGFLAKRSLMFGEICNKGFSESGSLKKHLCIYTEEEPLCKFCSKAFSQSGSLKKRFVYYQGKAPCL